MIRMVNQQASPPPQQPQPQPQRPLYDREPKIPIVNQLISSSVEGIHFQQMQCDAVISEYSRHDHVLIDKLGLKEPDAHWWPQVHNTAFQKRTITPGVNGVKILENIERVPQIPQIRPVQNQPKMVVKFDVNGLKYEWTYTRLKSHARAIDDGTVFAYKVDQYAKEPVQFLIERESTKEMSTPLSMYRL